MDSGNDFFLQASHSLFWAPKLAIFEGFDQMSELRRNVTMEEKRGNRNAFIRNQCE